jgi:acetate kinase
MREIEQAVAEGNVRAKLALDMYEYRIKKYLASYIGALNGVDVIVFTGGVGENQTGTRQVICEGLSWFGIEINQEINAKSRGKEVLLTTPESRIKVVVIPTDEEYMIASDTLKIVSENHWRRRRRNGCCAQNSSKS